MKNIKLVDLFNSVDEKHRSEIISKAEIKILKNGETLFCQGDSAQHVYMVSEGNMQLSTANKWGDNMIVRYITPGELMALISISESSEYPVTAQAAGDCRIFQWENKVFTECLHDYPAFALNVIEAVLLYLKYFQERFFAL